MQVLLLQSYERNEEWQEEWVEIELTIQNLEVVKVYADKNLIVVKDQFLELKVHLY